MSDPLPAHPRSYGCSYGCGSSYDVILISVVDGTTEFLCIPCFLKLTADMLTAMLNPDSIGVQAKMVKAGSVDTVPMTDGHVKARGKNAPATNDDPDLFDAFDAVISADELPEAFR